VVEATWIESSTPGKKAERIAARVYAGRDLKLVGLNHRVIQFVYVPMLISFYVWSARCRLYQERVSTTAASESEPGISKVRSCGTPADADSDGPKYVQIRFDG
jgi:hypothetical protein